MKTKNVCMSEIQLQTGCTFLWVFFMLLHCLWMPEPDFLLTLISFYFVWNSFNYFTLVSLFLDLFVILFYCLLCKICYRQCPMWLFLGNLAHEMEHFIILWIYFMYSSDKEPTERVEKGGAKTRKVIRWTFCLSHWFVTDSLSNSRLPDCVRAGISCYALNSFKSKLEVGWNQFEVGKMNGWGFTVDVWAISCCARLVSWNNYLYFNFLLRRMNTECPV